MSTVSDVLNQLEHQFRALDGVYERASDAAWTCADPRIKGAWQWMTHILEAMDFFLSDKPSDEFPWGHRFGVDWENDHPEHIPSKEAMRAYQNDMEQLVKQTLNSKTDADLAAPETIYHWTGQTYLSRLLYMMRHTQQHIGDINRGLRFNGCEALEWH